MIETVAIIGASEKPDRFANIAMHSLVRHGHKVLLVNPYKTEVEGRTCYNTVADVAEKIDTVTLYVNPTRFHDHIDEVLKAKPSRVIMNPGTEDTEAEKTLIDAGIKVLRACTLVLLSNNQF